MAPVWEDRRQIVVKEVHLRDADPAPHQGEDGEDHQGDRHYGGGFVDMGDNVRVAPGFSVEGEIDEAEHVEGRHEGGDDPQGVEEVMAPLEGLGQDLIFAEEAREGRDSGDGEGSHVKGDGREGEVATKPPHVAKVLSSPLLRVGVQGVDDAPCAEEQETFEEGVGHEVEDPGPEGPHPKGQKHVAELAHRGVSQDLFDVILDERNGGGEDGREGPDQSHHAHRHGGEEIEGVRAGHHVTPAVTMVAAWMRALTGVGPSMASGSQV